MKVAFLGVSPWAMTGYGGQTRGIIHGLLEAGHQVISLGHESGMVTWGGHKTYHFPDGKQVECFVFPNPLKEQIEAAKSVDRYCSQFGADLVIAHWDAFALEFLSMLTTSWLAYIPVEGPVTRKWANYVQFAEKVVAYSEYGRDELAKFVEPARLAHIRHGIDTKVFRPLSDSRQSLRPLLKTEPKVPSECFLYTVVAANSGPRKQLPQLLQTFAAVARDLPDAHLYLHTNANAPLPQGFDLPGLVDMLGLKERVHFPADNPIYLGLSDEDMVKIYNASDVTVTASLGEGFGVPVLESMACGVPVIAPRNSSHVELVGDERGWLVDVVSPEVYSEYPVYTPYLSTFQPVRMDILKARMLQAHGSDLLLDKGLAGRRFAQDYDWKRVMPQWLKLLEDIDVGVKLWNEMRQELKKR